MKQSWLVVGLSCIGMAMLSLTNPATPNYSSAYKELNRNNENLPSGDLFQKSITGFNLLKSKGLIQKNILSIIDFRISSNEKRLWIIDMDRLKILHHSLVAHGKNTGQEFAKYFSNKPQSYQSSLGFYITRETYQGKHGLSLYLDGVEKGINDKAKDRAIVMHGANYVSTEFINKYGRLGRSFGCPSVPMQSHKEIIYDIKGGSCLFIFYPNKAYLKSSGLIK